MVGTGAVDVKTLAPQRMPQVDTGPYCKVADAGYGHCSGRGIPVLTFSHEDSVKEKGAGLKVDVKRLGSGSRRKSPEEFYFEDGILQDQLSGNPVSETIWP